MKEIANDKITLCPSSRPELQASIVFGVVSGTVEGPHVAYLKQPQPAGCGCDLM